MFALISCRSGEVDPSDPLVWNNMKATDILKPKVFLCKAGLFLEKLNENLSLIHI